MDDMRHERMHMEDYDIMDDAIDTMMEIYDELDGSKGYIKKAMMVRDHDRSEADALRDMSAQELQHAENLRNNVTRMLANMHEAGHECYGVLHKVWTNISHRQMEYAAWIKQMHEQFKR